jgi:hypothetical protein
LAPAAPDTAPRTTLRGLFLTRDELARIIGAEPDVRNRLLLHIMVESGRR